MNLHTLISRITGAESRRLSRALKAERRRYSAIAAANFSRAEPGWAGVRSQYDEDALNKDYLYALGEVQGRAQDLDANNPDLHGFHRTRTAQIVGPGVKFQVSPRAAEIGLEPRDASAIAAAVNRLREIHSRLGGFDAAGAGRSEGKQQERAVLTMLVVGACLIHRVWRPGRRGLMQFSIELVPGTRISTPFEHRGDPLVSYGIRYSDPLRTEIEGYYVRRVSESRGDSFVPSYVWDLLPAEDCSLMSLTEIAGLDRALPLSLSVVRMLRNRAEFVEAALEGARAQAHHYVQVEAAPNADPFNVASDDADQIQTGENGGQKQFTTMDGVRAVYSANGEKWNPLATKLPDPDFPGFMAVTDQRCARGLVSSLSRFTRQVNSSWAGGRLEDQQDDPIIDQYRTTFVDSWRRVNEWFLDAVWLTGAAELPGYEGSRDAWCEFRGLFPAKVHIDPSKTGAAREMAFMQRTLAPQQACEEDGKLFADELELWAVAMTEAAEKEKQHGLPPHTLDILFHGRALTSGAGGELAPAQPEKTENTEEEDDAGTR